MDMGTISFEHLNVRRKGGRSNLLSCFIVLVFAAGMGAGCERRAASAPSPAPPDVEVARVIQKDVPIEGEWIGTLDGYVNAQIQPHVTGYQNGGSSYLQVLTNDTNYFSAELNLVQAQLNERLALVQLYLAVGGGWQQ